MTKYIKMFKWMSVILAGCSFVLSVGILPYLIEAFVWRVPEYEYLLYPALLFVWITSIGFYYMVLQIIMICRNAQSGKAFTMSTVKLFNTIALIAMVELVAYVVGFVAASLLIMKFNPLLLFALFVVVFFCLMVFGFCKVMKHLLRRVVEIKEENDYTI